MIHLVLKLTTNLCVSILHAGPYNYHSVNNNINCQLNLINLLLLVDINHPTYYLNPIRPPPLLKVKLSKLKVYSDIINILFCINLFDVTIHYIRVITTNFY